MNLFEFDRNSVSLGLIDYARVLFRKAICVWTSMDKVNAEFNYGGHVAILPNY